MGGVLTLEFGGIGLGYMFGVRCRHMDFSAL
jgi:hypothetical protein